MWLIPLFDNHAISLVLTRMCLAPDSRRTSLTLFKTFTTAQRKTRFSIFVQLGIILNLNECCAETLSLSLSPFFKTKIVRVLNLWQKNAVFDMNILQSLVDMANGNIISPNIIEGN